MIHAWRKRRLSEYLDGALTGLPASLTLPLAATAQTLLYYDLKARNSVSVDDPRPDVPREST